MRGTDPTGSGLKVTAVLNQGLPVHDWYLMPEFYSEPLVVEALDKYDLGKTDTILDPFSGTGTTVVTAVMRGVNGVGLEINPFLSFAARVKWDWEVDLLQFKTVLSDLLEEVQPLLDSISIERNLSRYQFIRILKSKPEHLDDAT